MTTSNNLVSIHCTTATPRDKAASKRERESWRVTRGSLVVVVDHSSSPAHNTAAATATTTAVNVLIASKGCV